MRVIWILLILAAIGFGVEKGYKYVRDPMLLKLQEFDQWAAPEVEILRNQTNDIVEYKGQKLKGKALLVCLEKNSNHERKYRPDIPSTDPLQLQLPPA